MNSTPPETSTHYNNVNEENFVTDAPATHHHHHPHAVVVHHPNPWGLYLGRCLYAIADHIPYFIMYRFFPSLDEERFNALLSLSNQYNVPYKKEEAAHVQLLGSLWEAHHRLFFHQDKIPFVAAQHAVHVDWKEMGFQASDPSTDFRGGGLLSLQQLCYLATHYPTAWTKMAGGDFLLAAAGINISMRLITLLGLNTRKNVLNAQLPPTYTRVTARVQLGTCLTDPPLESENENSKDAVALRRLNEVYCVYLELLFREWQKSDKNILTFNTLLMETYEEAERLLCLAPSVEQFRVLALEQ
ncbi:hypothetical protein AGDE_01317 [Angomonas deanei]|nr:hypothetical protein AGDE_01317 [Angomonas deanei]|eukprot:EPY42606.1 hypothetical protein AGDE_01317 [Angomonas deanei]